MRNRLFAWLAFLVLSLALPGSVAAQNPPSDQLHFATGLSFPAEVAGVRMTRWNDYGKSAGRPDLGLSYQYAIPGRLLVSVYVYNLNRQVPSGADNPVVAAQFEQAYGDIEKVAQSGRYSELKKVSGPAACSYGVLALRCVTFSAIVAADNRPVFTQLMLTGYRGHFVKLRLDWGRDSMANADVERFVRRLIEAMVQ
ncbi:MAG: hypothetical protein KIT36_11320 [Alphaproteobacteria bacterium]|nr:hypothetical protein [Alphaproteobacteria bacterium]